MSTLDNLSFNNTFYALGDSYYSQVQPQGIRNPQRVSVSQRVADLLDFDVTLLNSPDFVRYFSGNALLPGSKPLAMVYAGHQFGGYSPQLGDGRALLLGELETASGRWDLYLKGSGQTPYSRFGDGRAVLRSSIREYLCSEAMAGLGIPTTRALCVIKGDDPVMRETIEPSATIVRVAQSHIRFGSFEYFFYERRHEELKQLADYVIDHHYPDSRAAQNPYADFFEQVVKRTAQLIAHWQAVGFAHGVMNTDNMSILGQTFDYGPFGFIDAYEPGYICNHSDHSGRYAFDRQPQIGLWNLNALAHALSPLIDKELLGQILQSYQTEIVAQFDRLMQQKLGLDELLDSDRDLLHQLLEMLARQKVDYTLFFRQLSHYSVGDENDCARHCAALSHLFDADKELELWLTHYAHRLQQNRSTDAGRQQKMKRMNPKFILRNYLVQIAIDKAHQNDFSEVNRLLDLLYSPFDEHPGMEIYAAPPPEWGRKMEISCSS